MRRPVFLTVAVSLTLASSALFVVPSATAAKPAWTITKFPNPAGATSVDFESVTCPSAKSCFAVGFFQVGKANKTLVQHWNGSKWSVKASPNPAGATNSYLEGISCPTAKSCFAVGMYEQGATHKSLIERWDGTRWSIMASPNPVDLPDPFLESVACASATSCIAVGQPRVTTGEGIVVRWDGISWSLVTLAKLPGWTETSLAGVTCTSATNCFGVGFSQPSVESALVTLVERWDGNSWSVVPSPSPVGAVPAVLSRVACPSATSCLAVGSYSPPVGGGFKTLVERWNGTAWSIVSSPNPSASRNVLSDVSCAGPKSCTSVGHSFKGAIGKTLVERWNGSSWSLVASPNPAGSTNSWLKGVACPSATNCFAVGTARIKNATKGLIERFA